jgi:hypothetical protein
MDPRVSILPGRRNGCSASVVLPIDSTVHFASRSTIRGTALIVCDDCSRPRHRVERSRQNIEVLGVGRITGVDIVAAHRCPVQRRTDINES